MEYLSIFSLVIKNLGIAYIIKPMRNSNKTDPGIDRGEYLTMIVFSSFSLAKQLAKLIIISYILHIHLV